MSYRIDLHTHSTGSADGGLRLADYRRIFESGKLDYCAVTDHNSIVEAQAIQARLGKWAERIIIGEEIMTTDGEIIGLYLNEVVPAGLEPAETVVRIKAQGGIVYLPHPFETIRRGLSLAAAESIIDSVDIIETHNGRAVFQNRSRQAREFAVAHRIPQAAASDSHGRVGWGKTRSLIESRPTRQNLAKLLASASYAKAFVGAGIIYPKLNRLRRKLRQA